jgi:RNA polymerase sigma factor (sigma-70 family)
MSDTELFRDWQDKPCRETLLGLLEALGKSVYPLCFRILRHHQDAEDAAQKVLLEFLGVLRTLPSMDRIRAWIYRASILTALTLKRAQRRRMRYERTRRPQQGPFVSEEEGDLIHRHIADLDEDLRRVVVEHYFEGRTLSELSAKAHCSTGAIWKRLEKAQGELRRSLARAGLSGGALAVLGAFLGTREAGAVAATGLAQAVVEKARDVASGVPHAGRGWLKSAGGAAIAGAALLGFVAYRHRESPEAVGPASAAQPRSTEAASSIPARSGGSRQLPGEPAAHPEEGRAETLFARLARLRAALEVDVPKGSLGNYVREQEALYPLVLREPEVYVAFLRMPESRTLFSFFLDLLMYPGGITASSPLPDLPRTISNGLAELLTSGTKEQKLLIFDRAHQLGRSFRRQTLAEDFAPSCLQLVSGPDDDLRVLALGFLTSHGHEDRLDLVQNVWQKSRRFQSRMTCISILARSKGSAAGELLHQYLEEILKEQDPQWVAYVPMTLRDRLTASDTAEDQDRCMRLLSSYLRRESRQNEYQATLSVVGLLAVPKQALLLRELSGHGPSAAINDRIARTLELIDRGETKPGQLSETLLYDRPAEAASAPLAASEPPSKAVPESPAGDDSLLAQSDGPIPEAFDVLSKDGTLKAIIKKGKDGFASEFQVWDLKKDNRLLQGIYAFQITAFAFSPDGKSYAVADQEGVVVRSLSGGTPNYFQSQPPVKSLSFSADGKTLRSSSQSWTLTGR